MGDWIDYVVATVIVAAVLFSVHRHGRGNPETTGSIASQMRQQGARLAQVETGLQACATSAALEALAGEFRTLEARAATSTEVLELKGEIGALRVEMRITIDAAVKAADRTEDAVSRIEGLLMKRGFGA